MSGCIFTFHRLHRNERSRLVSILGHGNRRLYNQHTQIITEVDVKLNKWHIAMKKLYRKPSETEQFFFKNYDPFSGIEPSETQQARTLPIELAGNLVELV